MKPSASRRRAACASRCPPPLADKLGTHLVLAAPVVFHHRADEWWARVAARQAVRYDISYDPARGRWYLDASWKTRPAPMLELDDVRGGPVLGADLNADHLAACVLDASGNPIGSTARRAGPGCPHRTA
jgi:hypothetical protein